MERIKKIWGRIGKSSSSSPPRSPSPSPSSLPSYFDVSPPRKFACICVWNIDKYEWYMFRISDYDQPPPPPPQYINYLTRFHEDDEHRVVNLEPIATVKMDWILGWAILGYKALYALEDWSGDWRGPSVSKEGNRVYRIDLSRGTKECLSQMPNRISASAHTFVLRGKFYCLGGYPAQNTELERQSLLWAKPYDLSLRAGDSLPRAPCLDIDKIFLAAEKVPKSRLPSEKELESQSQLPKPHFPSHKMEFERQSQSFLKHGRIPIFHSQETLSEAKKVSKSHLPSQNMELERQPLWAMAYDPVLKKWESLPDPPRCPVKVDCIFSAAIEFLGPCIVVGSPRDGHLQIYHVYTNEWEIREFEICPMFGPDVLTGPALAVDKKLYWYSVDDLCLVGYDLMTKLWLVGNFPIHDHGEHFGVRDVDTPPRLAHLGGDKFCLLWVSVLPCRSMNISESKNNYISRLHCMKLQVTTGSLNQENGIVPLAVSILSCQSYLASGLKYFRGGLVLDGHLWDFDFLSGNSW